MILKKPAMALSYRLADHKDRPSLILLEPVVGILEESVWFVRGAEKQAGGGGQGNVS